MTTAKALLDKLEAFSIEKEVYKVIDDNSLNMVILNIQQLMQGRNRLGDYLSPRITEDPFFKSKKQAEVYARWKKRIYPQTPYDRPNLRINGYLHSTIEAERIGNSVLFHAMAGFTPSIDAKYNNTAFGLSPANKALFADKAILPEITRQLTIKTGVIHKGGNRGPNGWISAYTTTK